MGLVRLWQIHPPDFKSSVRLNNPVRSHGCDAQKSPRVADIEEF